ncbi:hypothetical protein RvY_13633 [Ramazzottius varieornatus]|uniref:Uncharacterized protein n=1 Tax=Ramazzottius varieornatus TaxID=947166 RepID=A0A1D1VQQ2_RAMVA|nr:hypothetical protein RvY_13633 [Ramazzottius varieornatus]
MSDIVQKALSNPTVLKRGAQGLLAWGIYRKFVQSPAMFRTLVGFAAGTYTGLYAAQNYNVPKVLTPGEAWNKVTSVAEDKAKEMKK